MQQENEWARRIYERDHLSEAFVSLPHHTGLDSYIVFSELKKKFIEKYGNDPSTAYVDEHARKMPTNPFFGFLKGEEDGGVYEEEFESILVQDKNFPRLSSSILDYSFPIKQLSEKNINIVRYYVKKELKKEASLWCREQYEQECSKVKKIREGWA